MGTVKAFVDLYTSCGFNNQTLKLSPTSCLFFLDLLSLQKLFVIFSSIAALNACDQDRNYVISRAFKPCSLEINSDGGFKLGHVESSISTIKNITPLPQCLRPPNLAGW